MDLISIPFGYILRYILQFVGSYGLAIILFTILTKLIILPLAVKSKSAMIDVQRLQPKLKDLQKKYATDKARYQQEVEKLYKAEGVNPAGSCLPTLITFPIMIGLYYVITRPLSFLMSLTPLQISQVAQRLGMDMSKIIGAHLNSIEISVANQLQGNLSKVADISKNIFEINFHFLGINLAATPQWNPANKEFSLVLLLIPILSGLTAFLMSRITMKAQEKISGGPMPGGQSTATMMYMMPLMSVWFGFMFPTGVGLYWIVSNIIGAIQEYFLTSYFAKKLKQKEAELEEKKRKRALRKEQEASKEDKGDEQ
ncbi:MAG: YidC/Oxa1 family membrane protein insertase [Clostridiales bacterium]|nr:YidC/Oxa1 family membrane protein insertase [Clostridiales bacterium]